MDRMRRCLLAGTAVWPIAAPVAHAQAPTKTLQVARGSQFKTLDPVLAFDDISSQLLLLAYSTLLCYSWLARPYRLQPDLLDRMPERSADGLTLSCTLRRGVMFPDDPCFPGGKGRELVVDDIFFSLRRFADARLNQRSWYLLEGLVQGLDEYRAATQLAKPGVDMSQQPVAGLVRHDSHRFALRLKIDTPLALYALANGATAVLPPEAVKHHGEGLATHPVGTGPFRLKDLDRKGVVRWTRNPLYHLRYPTEGAPGDEHAGHLADAGRRLPLVDVLEMPLIEESQPRLLKFLRGDLDIVGLDRAGTEKMVRREGGQLQLLPPHAQRHVLNQTASLAANYLWFNLKHPLLGKRKALRKAIAHLLNLPADIDTLLRGRGHHLASIVPPDIAGSERDTGDLPIAYDPARARQLLAESGFPDGRGLPELTLSSGWASTDWRDRFDFHRARFAAAGVRLKSQILDAPSFQKKLEASNFELAFYGWSADYPDAENFYQMLWSRHPAEGGNYAAFQNADYDRVYVASRFMANGSERYAHFRRMNAILRDEVTLVPLYSTVAVGLHQHWVRNVKRNAMVDGWQYVEIDTARRSKGLA